MRRSTLRRAETAPEAKPRDKGLHSTRTRPYDPIPDHEADRILQDAFTLLAEIGCRFDPGTEADTILAAAGCKVMENGVIRIPEPVIRAALASTAKQVTLWNRDASHGITIDPDHTWFMPGMTCIKVHDLTTGEHRFSTRDDLAMITRLADGMDHIDAVCVSVKDVPNSNRWGEVGEFLTMMQNTTKPLEYLCEWTTSLQAAIDMGAALRGSHDALREKPYFLHIITPLPLMYAEAHVEQIILCARAGIPTQIGTIAIGGASTPITTAGTLVHCLATDFAAMVLAQAAAPGAFAIGSTNPYFMEVATGGIGNLPQTILGEQIICQIRRRLGLPSFTALGGEANARRFSQDSVFEVATLMTQIFHNRPATCDYLGSIDQGITYSPQSLLLCNDIAGMLRAMWQGTVVDVETLALNLTREIGLFGTVLGHPHTARHCRNAPWNSPYFGANEPLATTDKPDEDLLQRINRDLNRRLAAPGPEPLPEPLLAQLHALHAQHVE